VDLATDPSHCGSCGGTCATGEVCSAGRCDCPAGKTACAGAGADGGKACVDLTTDFSSCGSCGRQCPDGGACASGSCQCAGAAQTVCGLVLGGGGSCCNGSGCCQGGTACMTTHSTGLGPSFYDCNPVQTYTYEQAYRAAQAWSPTGGVPVAALGCAGAACLCILNGTAQTATGAAVFCYGAPFTGLMSTYGAASCLAAPCPLSGTANTATWY
jgi:hypothetical protein